MSQGLSSQTIPPLNYLSPPRLTKLPPWKKLLYLKQPYPDNYTDKSFLSQLKRNTTVAKYSYIKLMDDFSLIVFYISCILSVILIFIGIYAHNWNPNWITIISSTTALIGFMYLSHSYILHIKTFLLISFILFMVSPILESLTKSTASDSIWALSFVLCIANVVFHEYSMNSAQQQQKFRPHRPIISTNISLSNAIVLASRLSSTNHVFQFILVSIQINILLPLFDSKLLQLNYKKLHWTIVSGAFIMADVLMYKLLNYKFLVYWLVGSLGLVVIMPAYFLSLQRYKNELQGPWDPAKPRLN
ncbi:Phosphatidylinositol N-acetylglucosaminyltransferase GPI2 subunit [Spathaspora sp. JA1]|nr:Phosphatidylinositol N-acetylglucosaminyltransferase GPI2 subunit [Spathaspora sp. JA1]